jgi:IS30 family transposase
VPPYGIEYRLDNLKGGTLTVYTQLSRKERDLIYLGHGQGKSAREIAKNIGRPHQTVAKEIRRNACTKLGYLPDTAHNKAHSRKRRNQNKILQDIDLQKYVHNSLDKCWSPEQMSGRMRFEKTPFYAAPETIYRYIYKHEHNLCKQLPRRQQRRITKLDRRPHPADADNQMTPIRLRPKAVKKRRIIGHWEGDTIFFTRRTKQNLTVLVERKSRLVKLRRNTFKCPEQVNQGIVDVLKRLPGKMRKSITLDRGTEFTMPQYLGCALGLKVWYCDRASPYQKGSVERINGQLRCRFLPKNFEIENVDDSYIGLVEETMNATPRRILGYRTPIEIFNQNTKKQGLNPTRHT